LLSSKAEGNCSGGTVVDAAQSIGSATFASRGTLGFSRSAVFSQHLLLGRTFDTATVYVTFMGRWREIPRHRL
jgi:hypothetical protein